MSSIDIEKIEKKVGVDYNKNRYQLKEEAAMQWLLKSLIVISVMAMYQGIPSSALSQQTPDRYIVVLDEALAPEAVPSVADELSRQHGLALGHIYKDALKGFSAQIPPAGLDALRSDFRINNIVEDKVLTAFCHANNFQTLPSGIDRVEADQSPAANINNSDERINADIAILDTGVYKHADLNVAKAVDCTGRNGCKVITTPSDPNGHGTHVAGIAAAIDNSKYVVGVAPGARIWSVRVLGNSGSGFTSWIIAGIDYITANSTNIEVANMSLGGPGSDTGTCGVNSSGTVIDPFHKAICNSVDKGVVYTVAAGNDFQDAANTIPAAYDEAITVSALDDKDGKPAGDAFATFSNFGSDVDLIAPGNEIFSLFPGDKRTPGGFCATMSGTSMAAPHVAGGVALYLATHPKPVDSAGTGIIRDILKGAGECPDGISFSVTGCSGSSWTGDPDGFTEPLLNVNGF